MKILILPWVVLFATSGLQAATFSRTASFNVGTVVVDSCRLIRALGFASLQRHRNAELGCLNDRIDTRDVAQPVTQITLAKDGTISAIRLEF